MQSLKPSRMLPFLVAIATLIPIGVMTSTPAIAISENQEKGCLNDSIFRSNFLPRFVFVDRDDSPVNVRENPTIDSAIIYAAPPGSRVFPKKQVLGENGYCWLQVNVPSRDVMNGFFSGWVRGDLVIIRFGR